MTKEGARVFLVAGLGNPGIAYEKSRHNAGFWALDALAELLSIRVTKKGFSSVYGEGILNGQRVLLLKPQTYMNLSGNAVQSAMHFYKIPAQNLTVLLDDIDLPVGALRIRAGGSAGTHNGLRSVLAAVGEADFARVRIGVGDRRGDRELADYVIASPSKAEMDILTETARAAAEAVKLILLGQLSEAQTLYNKKHQGGTDKADPG